MILLVVFFFFSSRRRHTRLQGDWSSDVCSSDLADGGVRSPAQAVSPAARGSQPRCPSAGREAQGTAQEKEGEQAAVRLARRVVPHDRYGPNPHRRHRDRKSTRLNSSHLVISYAVFCLKKKKTKYNPSYPDEP